MKNIFMAGISASVLFTSGISWAVSADEAKALGQTLTEVGAEKAASTDGLIPAYTGGLKTPPGNFKSGSGMRPDPFADEKPSVSITNKNVAQYGDKLTEGTKALLARYVDYRLDVYPTHRTVTFPKIVLDNTAKNATRTHTVNGVDGIEGAFGGFPFPIPHNGAEVMWNHLVRYRGVASTEKYDNWNIDSAGAASLSTTGQANQEWPYYDPSKTTIAKPTDLYFMLKVKYTAPARRAGEGLMALDAVDPIQQPRRAWQYLPGQRRVKLAPDLAYDTPNPGQNGSATFDDGYVFNGALDRYDWKLIGKKVMVVPYNAYRLTYHENPADVTKPNFLNPDLLRWEMHRVWVVEGTLRSGKRHIYAKRRFYIDEDSWTALASDEYDAHGQLYRSGFSILTFSYDVMAPASDNFAVYDFVSRNYSVNALSGPHGGIKYTERLPEKQWTADALAGAGLR